MWVNNLKLILCTEPLSSEAEICDTQVIKSYDVRVNNFKWILCIEPLSSEAEICYLSNKQKSYSLLWFQKLFSSEITY